jgi:hypothetical protein
MFQFPVMPFIKEIGATALGPELRSIIVGFLIAAIAFAPIVVVFYRHHYPNGIEETRDTHRFNTLAEAEKFAETMRQTERFCRNLD